ncbi:MAG: LysM peptidoglycan-binding domain-containing protein [Saprospiraceae bacterium]|nr:LysM peptidoglycan-binding domain-containing protein [Saprospiraceae bacterium]
MAEIKKKSYCQFDTSGAGLGGFSTFKYDSLNGDVFAFAYESVSSHNSTKFLSQIFENVKYFFSAQYYTQPEKALYKLIDFLNTQLLFDATKNPVFQDRNAHFALLLVRDNQVYWVVAGQALIFKIQNQQYILCGGNLPSNQPDDSDQSAYQKYTPLGFSAKIKPMAGKLDNHIQYGEVFLFIAKHHHKAAGETNFNLCLKNITSISNIQPEFDKLASLKKLFLAHLTITNPSLKKSYRNTIDLFGFYNRVKDTKIFLISLITVTIIAGGIIISFKFSGKGENSEFTKMENYKSTLVNNFIPDSIKNFKNDSTNNNDSVNKLDVVDSAIYSDKPFFVNFLVHHGVTLYHCSKIFNLSIEEIMADNGLTSTTIYQGTVLKIRAKGIHVIEDGDNIIGISEKYHTDVNQLLQANEIEKNTHLEMGDTLIIPLE